jgi:acetyl-CoA carboxylase/biotin carboxylase 1
MVTLGIYSHLVFLPVLIPSFAAAFEVYVRRAYRAYSLLSIDYDEGDGLDDGLVPSILTWRFNLGRSHSPPTTPRMTLR